jgi:starch synthase
MKILFISAENGALKGGKVGGIGDVVEQLPPALADLGNHVVVLTPSHGFLHRLNPENRLLENVFFLFRGYEHQVQLYEIFPEKKHAGVRHLVVDHPLLASPDPSTGRLRIYSDDPETPFATDANRFALFCAAASQVVVTGLIGPFDSMHLHDWHSALIAFLRQFSPRFMILRSIPTAYTIHNLGIQGIRPLRGHSSSLEAWFPDTAYEWDKVSDPRWTDCVNTMALGIRLSDMVHTVSPSYALEIQENSRKPEFYGGEGLESDLKQASAQGRLVGILNGCDYDESREKQTWDYFEILSMFKKEVLEWAGMSRSLNVAHFIAYARLTEMEQRRKTPDIIISFVGRVVEQKLLLFFSRGSDGKPGLESILEALGQKGCVFILGSGDLSYEAELISMSSRHENLVFLNHYSDQCAQALYSAGNLFLMPSSYEPCGISQLLAMREGQPCVVHRVGGLKDTVEHEKNGFSFEGKTLENQVDNFVKTVAKAVHLRLSDSGKWDLICRNAAQTRFTWRQSAKQYMEILYPGVAKQ